jgi:hypothetical protein
MTPRRILGAAILQPGLGAPGHSSLIAIDYGRAEPALGRLLLREHAGQITALRLAERMLLPDRALGIERGNSGRIVLAPAALSHRCPPLGCLPRLHAPTAGTAQSGRWRSDGDTADSRQIAEYVAQGQGLRKGG